MLYNDDGSNYNIIYNNDDDNNNNALRKIK